MQIKREKSFKMSDFSFPYSTHRIPIKGGGISTDAINKKKRRT